jgi:hypothetical protein
LYGIVIIVVIILLTIMWTDNGKKEVTPPVVTPPVTVNEEVTPVAEPSLSSEIDNINLDSGIDADLNAVDTDIKTL